MEPEIVPDMGGLPLAWGAEAHTGTCHQEPSFLQAAKGQGIPVRLDRESGFLFS
jgi:hypothetical protein